MNAERGGRSAECGGPDAQRVHGVEQLRFQGGVILACGGGTHGTQERVLRQSRHLVERGADADADAADDDQAEGPVESTAEREADAVDDDAGEATEA